MPNTTLPWLDKLHEDFVEAFRSNDLKALGAFYTDDAVLLPPGRPMVSGREAIVAYWQGAERIQDLVFEATDTRMLGGETALREAGNLLVTARGRGRDTRNVAAKYVAIWLKVEGGWKLDSTVWNNASRRQRAGGRRGAGGGGGGQGAGGGGQGRGAGGGGGQGRGAGAGRQGRGAGGGRGRRGPGAAAD